MSTDALPATPPATLVYTLTTTPKLEVLELRVCPDTGGALPARLVPGEPKYAPYLTAAQGPRGALPLSPHVDTSSLSTDECVDLRIDAARAADDFRSPRAATVTGSSLVTAPDLWLYRPTGSAPITGELTTALPSGVYMSAPWPADDGGVRTLDDTAFTWLSRVAFGPHAPVSVTAPGGELEVFVLDPERGPSDAVTTAFLSEVASALALSTGVFPRPFAQVTLESTHFSEDVAFGLVLRGGGPGAHLLLSPRASAQTLARAWVPTHELSHLFLPFVGSRGRYFSEGLATYYQNVLRARAGLISEEQAWQKLHAGMTRGRDAADGKTPVESSIAMRSEHNFSHIYWSGTALFLLLDVALRTRAEAPSSVDDVLNAISACCLNPRRYNSIETLTKRIDARIGGNDISRLTTEVGMHPEFPAFERVYAQLGLAVKNGALAIVDADNPLRRAITGRRSPLARP